MTNTILYYDSSVWSSYILGHSDIHFEESEKQIQRLYKGHQAVVSYLVILEVMGVIRKRIVERENFTGQLNDDLKKELREKIKQKISQFFSLLIRLKNEDKIRIRIPDIPLEDYFKTVLKHYKNTDNDISISGFKLKYKELGHYDLQHAIHAAAFANEFITNDHAFKYLNGTSAFSHLAIVIVK